MGAVIVKEGVIVGEGYTQPPGSAHAEVVALEQQEQPRHTPVAVPERVDAEKVQVERSEQHERVDPPLASTW